MNPSPNFQKPLWLFLTAALLASIAWGVDTLAVWQRMFLVAAVWIFAYLGLVTHVNWVYHEATNRIRERGKAKFAGIEVAGAALRGLNSTAIDLIARHDTLKIGAYLSRDSVLRVIHAPGGDIPEEFMYEFLVKSLETEPYLWPVREHDVFDWPKSEEMCERITDCLIYEPVNLARKAAGNHAAELKVSVEIALAYFGWEV